MADIAGGRVLGNRFTVVGVLGRGGMATVYLALDQLRGEKVALKVLHDHLANTASMRERLRREVLASGRIRHPNALVAFELHEIDGALALSLPLHPGRTLQERIDADGPLGPDALRELGLQLSGALAEAHRQGVVHRDVTPHNVMIDDRDHAALTDFGLARLEDLRTATGTGVVGTAGYAAPEIYQSVRADPRADLYSLGAVLYFAATGRPPFEAPNPMGVLKRQLEEDFVPLTRARPELPADLAATIEAMLRRDPGLRPQGARAVEEALESRDATPAVETAPPPLEEISPRAPAAAALPPAAASPASDATRPAAPGNQAVSGPDGRQDQGSSLARPAPGQFTPGTWTVIVQARPGDPRVLRRRRERRNRRRERREMRALRRQRNPLEVVREVARTALGGGQEHPEQALAATVASMAGLPAEALRVTSAMYSGRFRLIEDVDAAAAFQLAQAAQRLGYRTEVLDQTTRAAREQFTSPGEFIRQLAPIPAILFGVFGIMMAASRFPPMIMLIFPLFFTLFRIIRRTAQRAATSVGHIPLAYTRDLTLYLEPSYRLALEEGRIDAAAPILIPSAVEPVVEGPTSAPGTRRPAARPADRPASAREADGATSARAPTPAASRTDAVPAPSRPAGPADRVEAMVLRTEAQLEALARLLTDRAADLAANMLSDLRVTLDALSSRARSLGTEARRLQQELEAVDDLAVSATVTRIEARIQRLETLQQAGQPANGNELDDLRRGLEAHRQTQASVEALEARSTLALARLLEIGSAAGQARRDLLREDAPARSAVRLLEQLRQEVAAATGALIEVEKASTTPVPIAASASIAPSTAATPISSTAEVPDADPGESTEDARRRAIAAGAVRQGGGPGR